MLQYSETTIEWHFKDREFILEFVCSRNSQHTLKFYFQIKDKILSKIGQFPSFADLHRSDTKNYQNVLEDIDAKELAQARGLFSHGVGIGSFVYLRRIFERLIGKAQAEAVEDGKIDPTAVPQKVLDKITILKDYLPDFLVSNKQVYSILSKGIHELSDQECLSYFEIIDKAICLILNEEIARINKKKSEEAMRLQLQQLHQDLSKK